MNRTTHSLTHSLFPISHKLKKIRVFVYVMLPYIVHMFYAHLKVLPVLLTYHERTFSFDAPLPVMRILTTNSLSRERRNKLLIILLFARLVPTGTGKKQNRSRC